MAKKADDGYDHWTCETYTLLQIIPVRRGEYLAVYAGDKKDDGSCELFGSAVDALALARVTTEYLRRRKGASRMTAGERESPKDEATDVVALELSGGYWHICQDSGNFAGLCRAGDDLYEADGCLDTRKYGTPKRPAESPEKTE